MSTTEHEIKLTGLSGSSLLGFMSALGTLNTLGSISEAAGVKMRWTPDGSSFRPSITLPTALDSEALLRLLDQELKAHAGHATTTFAPDLKVTAKRFRLLAERQCEAYLSHQDHRGASVVAAFGCDAISNEEGNIEDTAFRTMSGAGHQHFLAFMNDLAKETNSEHLREALFGPWRYRDPSPIMRWDDEDDRRYALRWDEPSKDPVRTVRGANRLAIAALPLFTVVPVSSSTVATTAFRGRKSNDTFVTWPLWSGWLGIDAVRSVLSRSELQRSEVASPQLGSLGILTVCRSQRITLGKYRNFTPAEAL
ncbi:MAG: hypothetical protein JNM99_16815 [Verrucomicrobiaceae bacterium]|nr:hypothetical protein [Verrucomicrobiaceae bacterium]